MPISITHNNSSLFIKILPGGDWSGDLAKIKSFKGCKYLGEQKLWQVPEHYLFDVLGKWEVHDRSN